MWKQVHARTPVSPSHDRSYPNPGIKMPVAVVFIVQVVPQYTHLIVNDSFDRLGHRVVIASSFNHDPYFSSSALASRSPRVPLHHLPYHLVRRTRYVHPD